MEQRGYRFGWWTTGRDEAALELLKTVLDAMDSKKIEGHIAYIFLSRAPGDGKWSDEILQVANEWEIPCVTLSAKDFMPELRASSRARWRESYHKKALELILPYGAKVHILAGYMWVVSAEACSRLRLLNLHPALPGGPEGTWQEVIWKLIEKGADRTGAMMHLVTPELDKGPPVAYFSFPIKGGKWDRLWKEYEDHLKRLGTLERVKDELGEGLPLFKEIRAEGVKRELPLIVATMEAISKGEIDLEDLKAPVELRL